jgi:hypothetical protein
MHCFPRHEDGSVRFWDASSTNLPLLYKYSSAPVFVTEAASPDADEEEWPPFKKVRTSIPVMRQLILYLVQLNFDTSKP